MYVDGTDMTDLTIRLDNGDYVIYIPRASALVAIASIDNHGCNDRGLKFTCEHSPIPNPWHSVKSDETWKVWSEPRDGGASTPPVTGGLTIWGSLDYDDSNWNNAVYLKYLLSFTWSISFFCRVSETAGPGSDICGISNKYRYWFRKIVGKYYFIFLKQWFGGHLGCGHALPQL